MSHNVVHAADPSQIRKDGSRRVPDQGNRRGVEELPTPIFAIASDVRQAAWGASVVMQDDDVSSRDVYRAMHDGACAVSGHNEQQ